MKNSMFLLEVYYGHTLYKRRISDSIEAIHDWLFDNAVKWENAVLDIVTTDDCHGTICLHNSKRVLYTFKITNIAVI